MCLVLKDEPGGWLICPLLVRGDMLTTEGVVIVHRYPDDCKPEDGKI